MARVPGRPVDEEGKTIFPSATVDDDDVQGHIALAAPPDEEAETSAPES